MLIEQHGHNDWVASWISHPQNITLKGRGPSPRTAADDLDHKTLLHILGRKSRGKEIKQNRRHSTVSS